MRTLLSLEVVKLNRALNFAVGFSFLGLSGVTSWTPFNEDALSLVFEPFVHGIGLASSVCVG